MEEVQKMDTTSLLGSEGGRPFRAALSSGLNVADRPKMDLKLHASIQRDGTRCRWLATPGCRSPRRG